MILTKEQIKALNYNGEHFLKDTFSKNVKVDFQPFFYQYRSGNLTNGSHSAVYEDSDTLGYSKDNSLFYIKYVSNSLKTINGGDADNGGGLYTNYDNSEGMFIDHSVIDKNTGSPTTEQDYFDVNSVRIIDYMFCNAFDIWITANQVSTNTAAFNRSVIIEGYLANYR